MRVRKRNFYLPPKLFIHPTINSEAKRSKILHANIMVQTMGNTHLDISDSARLHVTIHCGTNRQDIVMRNPLVTKILTQYYVSKGIKVFGDPSVVAFLKELKQLYRRMDVDPKNSDEMTTCQKNTALQYLMFLKQKRCVKIKGRGCSVGIKQRKYLTKDDTITPTLEMEALFLTCLIDTMEHREVATVDIPGAFIQVYMEGETVHKKLEGKMVDLITKLNPNIYYKYVTKKKGVQSSTCSSKIPIRYTPGRASILDKSGINPTGVGILGEPIQLVRLKQDILWKINDSCLAHGQPEDIPQKWRHSGRPNQ